ncbi:type II toxin-antitoxin system MqsA family antitoxin [Desulfoluna sp.]|uniref:helix-turn-helix domain-containing protein n=1 Tax=Desulfoluna sp. TaxID=2045199 RepID=UPI002607C91B|nr:type II toxin-antitoxin system MqsA family antitoxin [Desulfoluna sp.]
MENKHFDELVKSMEEGAAMVRGQKKPSRRFTFPPLEIHKIRLKTGKTQLEFSHMLGVSVKTLRNWEQGQRTPNGPAQALLKIVSKHPELVEEALQDIGNTSF